MMYYAHKKINRAVAATDGEWQNRVTSILLDSKLIEILKGSQEEHFDEIIMQGAH